MTVHTRDPDFVAAVREIFKEAADKMLTSEKVMLQIEQLWLKAIEKERERLFGYMSREDVVAAFGEHADLMGQLRWLIGNGTYLSDAPDMSLIPPFMQLDPSKYSVSTSGRDQWSVKMDGGLAGDQEVGRIEKLNNEYWAIVCDPSGQERKMDQPFGSLDGAVKFFEAVLQSLATGMKPGGHLRESNDEKNMWVLEDSDCKKVGSIYRGELPVLCFRAVLYEEGIVGEASEFKTFDGAEQWLRTKASFLKRSA